MPDPTIDLVARLRDGCIYDDKGFFWLIDGGKTDELLSEAADRIERLEEALKPFADEFGEGIPRPDDFVLMGNLNLGHFRAARQALGSE